MWATPRFGCTGGSVAESGGLGQQLGAWILGEQCCRWGPGRMLEGPHCCNLFSLSFQASQNITLITYASLQPSDRDPRIVHPSLGIPGG